MTNDTSIGKPHRMAALVVHHKNGKFLLRVNYANGEYKQVSVAGTSLRSALQSAIADGFLFDDDAVVTLNHKLTAIAA